MFLIPAILLNIAQHQARRCPDKIRDKSVSIKIDYSGSGNKTEFVYDGQDRNRKIVEVSSGVQTSERHFVWSSDERNEERDGSGNLNKTFYRLGQTVAGANFFYRKNHLNSITEITDGVGQIQGKYIYSPYGVTQKQSIGTDSDFQYAGYYSHARSGLALPVFRAYNATLGRFMNRDPIEESGGLNLYAYVQNPISFSDPHGLHAQPVPTPTPVPTPEPPSPGDPDTGGGDATTVVVIVIGTIIVVIIIIVKNMKREYCKSLGCCQAEATNCLRQCDRLMDEEQIPPCGEQYMRCRRCCRYHNEGPEPQGCKQTVSNHRRFVIEKFRQCWKRAAQGDLPDTY